MLERLMGGARGDSAADGENVHEAMRRWQEAVRYFESVKDPELMDFAIYEMEAARRKYVFLLKRASVK